MSDATTQEPTSPIGIKIICVIGVLGVLVILNEGVLAVTRGSFVIGFIDMLNAGVQVIVIYGLWTLRPWGWLVALFVYGLSLVFYLYQLVIMDVSSILSIGITLVIIWYIYTQRSFYKIS